MLADLMDDGDIQFGKNTSNWSRRKNPVQTTVAQSKALNGDREAREME